MEQAIQGWNNIAKMFGVHKNTMLRRRREMEEAGVIFYILVGRPKTRRVCAFPSLLKAWAARKAAKGERI